MTKHEFVQTKEWCITTRRNDYDIYTCKRCGVSAVTILGQRVRVDRRTGRTMTGPADVNEDCDVELVKSVVND